MISILAGTKRGAKLTEVNSPSIRPTAQRTREALFNILNGGRLACELRGSLIIDIFAGSGALGFEALSRGAAHAIFIEKDKQAISVLTRNSEKLGFQDQTTILQGDACQLDSWHHHHADIILCDAPYDSGLSLPALQNLKQLGAIAPASIIAVETRHKEPQILSDDFQLLDSRNYGIARLSFFQAS